MNSTLNYLRSHRSWLVENIDVSGVWPGAMVPMIASEGTGADRRVVFTQVPLGGQTQTIAYADLTDFRGAPLPVALSKPKVIVLPKSGAAVIVVGPETANGFALANTSANHTAASVDLWIVELGRDE